MKSGPIVRNPGLMDPRIFRDDLMQLEETLLSVGLAQRVSFDADRNTAATVGTEPPYDPANERLKA